MFKREAQPVNVAGIDLRCQVCGGDRFHHRRAQLNSAVASFFSLDWLDAQAECLMCERCGYIHWFLPMTWSEAPPAEAGEG